MTTAIRAIRHCAFSHVVLFMFILLGSVWAQDPAAGVQLLSTNQFGIDLASSNVFMALPIRSKTSGPMPLSASLIGNFHVYNHAVKGQVWTQPPVSNPPGAIGQFGLQIMGVPAQGASPSYAPTGPCSTTLGYAGITLYGVTDATGAAHNIHTSPPSVYPTKCGGASSATVSTGDGSGYTIIATADPTNEAAIDFLIYDSAGNAAHFAPFTPGSAVATNAPVLASVSTPDGVTVTSVLDVGTGQYNGTFVDPLSSNPFIATKSAPIPSGFSQSYSYTDATGATQKVVVTYATTTVKTNFGCTQFPDYPATSVYMPVTIALPGTNGSYGITYEATGSAYPGDVTGRIASITYPSGGSVSYAYSGGTGSANGYDCIAQIAPTIVVTTNDNNGNVEQWTYISTKTGITSGALAGTATPAFTVSRADPLGNVTVYNFAGYEFQTQAAYYQGPATGTPLKTVVTCYNNNYTSCASPSIQPTLPITETNVYTSYNGQPPNLVQTKLDIYGNQIEVATYDFGVSTGGFPSGAVLSNTLSYYGQSFHVSGGLNGCTSYPVGTYIHNTPCYTDAGGHVTEYTRNATGHPTITKKWVGGNSWLTASATYNASNGMVETSTSLTGVTSEYTYGDCNGLLPTAVDTGGLTSTTVWNCDNAVVTSTNDSNKSLTSYVYDDSLIRVTSKTDPMSNVTNYTYTPTQTETVLKFGSSTLDTVVTTDGLGRPILSQTRQGIGSSQFDTVNTLYSSNGQAVTVPYVGTIGQLASPGHRGPTGGTVGATPRTTTVYDPISRTVAVENATSGYTAYTYNGNVVLQQTGSFTTGFDRPPTIAASKQLQYNGLGQLTAICEIVPSGANVSSGTCNGYVTAYTNDPFGHILQVVQGAQTRTFAYDGMGRLTSENNPESGATTYTYDGTACGSPTSYPGRLTGAAYTNGNTQCFEYNDPLGRLTDSEGSSSTSGAYCKRFRYDSASNGVLTDPDGGAAGNRAGRMVEAETDNCSFPVSKAGSLTDEWLAYDLNGRVTDLFESTPHSGGYYHTIATFWPNNTLATLEVPKLSAWNYIPDGEGRPNTASYGGATWVANTSYWPSNGTGNVSLPFNSVKYSTGDVDTYLIDPNSGQTIGFTFNIGSVSLQGTGQWAGYGPLINLNTVDGFNANNSQNCIYGYDGLLRVSSVDCTNSAGTSVWGQLFSFDAYGNISKSLLASGSAGSAFLPNYTTNNHYTLTGCTPQVSYDGSGNLLNDCFHTYTWDGYGNLASVDAKTVTYDALNRQVENNSGANQILMGPTGKLGVMKGQIPSLIRFPLPGGETAEMSSDGTRRLLHTDWSNNVRLSTNFQDGTVVNEPSYAPYAEAYNATSTTDLSFTGQSQDTVPGLYDFAFREYSPVGRWISPDPSGQSAVDPTDPQTWNRYSYVTNRPMNSYDPLGLDCAYLNDDGTAANNIDQGSNEGECASTGGYWIAGKVLSTSWITANADAGTVVGQGLDANGNFQTSIAGAMAAGANGGPSNPWGSWTQNFGTAVSSDIISGNMNPPWMASIVGFFRGYWRGPSIGPGSCLGGFYNAAVASPANAVASNVKKYAPVLVAALQSGPSAAVAFSKIATAMNPSGSGAASTAEDVAAATTVGAGMATAAPIAAQAAPYAAAGAVMVGAQLALSDEEAKAFTGQCIP